MLTARRFLQAWLAAAMLALFAGLLAPPAAGAADLVGVDEVNARINAQRAKYGLAPLRLDSYLCQAAMIRANEMLALWDHTRPDGRDFDTVLWEMDISAKAWAENIAWNTSPAPAAVVGGWMHSPPHRATILSDAYDTTGIARSYDPDSGRYYWVQLFVGGSNLKGLAPSGDDAGGYDDNAYDDDTYDDDTYDDDYDDAYEYDDDTYEDADCDGYCDADCEEEDCDEGCDGDCDDWDDWDDWDELWDEA